MLATFFYGERPGLWRWGAVIIGFIGVLLIVRPGSEVFKWTSVFPIGAAFCYAASMVSLRSFDRSTSNAILYLYSAFSAAISAIIFAAITTEFTPIQFYTDAILILSMSICGGFGVVFLMYAFRHAPASVLAPFSYFGLITAFAFGWFLFGELPIDTLFPGIIFIILSGFTILWREQTAKS